MAQEKITAPQSSAGITKFYDVVGSGFLLDPKIVIGIAIALIVLELGVKWLTKL
ncbi:MAG: preprotein translocase subunit Sec61beta [Candidatus Micrarchaeota archaeon]